MKIDICIPVYRNLNCLRVAVSGLQKSFFDRNTLGDIYLHIEDPAETQQVVGIFGGIDTEIVSHGDKSDMATYMNRLLGHCTSDWVLFMEQDTFLHVDIDGLAMSLDALGFIAAGPLDTMHTCNANAKGRALYGEYMRLSPQPGFFHSSLIFLKRSEMPPNPFTIPKGFKMHGTGVLGGESYYGLRINLSDPSDYMLKKNRDKLCFFEQSHCGYGYAASITWDSPLATHLYFSGTKDGYRQSGWLSESDHEWLVSEEQRFLQSYMIS